MSENKHLCMGCMNEIDNSALICPVCGFNPNSPHLAAYLVPGTMLSGRYIVGKVLHYNGEGASYIGFDTASQKKILIREYMPDVLAFRVKGDLTVHIQPGKETSYKSLMSDFISLQRSLIKLRTLSHVVSIFDVLLEYNTAYAICEYIEGVPLRQFLQENAGELSWPQAKKMFLPLFTTLNLLHEQNIIHRGISLDTLVVDRLGQLTLTGFCISDTRTAKSELAPELAPGFAAPEQYVSSEWQGPWTDVYAVCAVLYRTLTGTLPPEALSRRTNDNLIPPAQLNRSIPFNISQIIVEGLRLSPEKRIKTIEDLTGKIFNEPQFVQDTDATRAFTPANVKAIRTEEEDEYEEEDEPAGSRWKMALLIGGITLLVLLAIGIAIIVFVLHDDTKKPSDLSSDYTSSESSSDLSDSSTSSESSTSASISSTSDMPGADFVVPNFIGKDYDVVINSESYTSKLTFAAPNYEYNDTYAEGVIIKQSIDEDTKVVSGTEIVLTVSLGPKTVTVPDYEGGMPLEVYQPMLENLNIPFEIKYVEVPQHRNGYVINTSVAPGDKFDITTGEKLVVTVVKNSDSSSSS